MEYQPSPPALVGFGLGTSLVPLAVIVAIPSLKLSVITGLNGYWSYENAMSAWDPRSHVLYGFARSNSTRSDTYSIQVDVSARKLIGGEAICTDAASPSKLLCPFNFFYA